MPNLRELATRVFGCVYVYMYLTLPYFVQGRSHLLHVTYMHLVSWDRLWRLLLSNKAVLGGCALLIQDKGSTR